MTISELGPVLLTRLLGLNDTQESILNIVFRVADERGLLLIDLMDLRAMLNFVAEKCSRAEPILWKYSSSFGWCHLA
jgi:DNA helicase HerA-like ATPase